MKKHMMRIAIMVLAIAFTCSCSVNTWAKCTRYPCNNTVADRDDPRPGEKFYFEPFAPTYDERLEFAIQDKLKSGRGNKEQEVLRAWRGMDAELSEKTVTDIEERLAGREDCADFTSESTVILMSANARLNFIKQDHHERIKKALLGFKYWVDEPGFSRMIFWTENHQIAFHASEYLAGQLFPDDVFTNNGETGAWHREHARKLILKWMERRMKWGFSEWDSVAYYGITITGVLALAEFAEDKDVATAAAQVADLLFLDMFSDLYKGVYGTSHGRAYDNDVLSGYDSGIGGIISLVTGRGKYRGIGSAELVLAIAERYRPPEMIIKIGQEAPAEFTGYERHGIPLEKINEYGISRTKLEDAPTLWGMGAHTQPMVIDLFLKAADTWNLWDVKFIRDGADASKNLPRDGSVGRMRKSWRVHSDRTLIGEANKITYRTPYYMLSSTQDYRAGEMGNQHHVWQATLSPSAVVFTNNPGSSSMGAGQLGYWAGHNRFPRIAQYKNLAVIIYRINMQRAMGETEVYDFSHAFFPKWAFEEVVEKDGWIFGKVDDGYIALYSAQPYEWKDPDYEFVHDAIATGTKNIWLCQMGSVSADGSFQDFVNTVLSADKEIDIEGLTVNYDAPGIGKVEFSWKGDFKVNDSVIPLSGYKRMENPYVQSEFNSGVYIIEHGGERHTLDFDNMIRKTEMIE